MKLLHVIASVNPATGGPIEGILVHNAVSRDRAEREIVCCDRPDDAWVDQLPVRVHPVGVPPAKTRDPVKRFLDHYRYTPRLVPWLQENIRRYDAVVVNGVWNYTALAAARTLPDSGIPYFVYPHGQLDPWFRKAYPLKELAKQFFWWFNEGRLLKGARAVCFTSDEERRLVRNRYFGHQDYREAVVGYGTTDPPAPTSEQTAAFRALVPDLRQGRSFFLFLGRIHRKKGCDILVEAFARVGRSHPEVHLVIAGPDQEGWMASLRARAAMLGVFSRIHWPGMLSGQAKWGAFRAADAFILPSHSENFGLAVAEAMACGTPVLISDKVNIWREVEESGGGLVEPDTVEGVARLMARWLALPPGEREAMRLAARGGFERHFRIEAAAERMLGLVREAIAERGRVKGAA